MAFQKVKPTRIFEAVAEQIEETILSGRFGPGEKLPPERKMIDEFGVSRRTLCEAPEFKEDIQATLARQSVNLINARGNQKTVKLNLVTTNFEEALHGVRYIMMTVPSKKTNKIIEDIRTMYPVVPGENVLSTSLNNLNPIVHPIGTILNA